MRLFISYARVDKYYCSEIVDVLDVHDVWFDNRLHAGQQWWDEIQRRLEWCEGLVYLLSPDSINSKYCQKEFEIARMLGKHIFPVLIHARTPIPDSLQYIQYADLSSGITPDAVKLILNSIYVAERQGVRVPQVKSLAVSPVSMILEQPSTIKEAEGLISEAVEAFDCEQYDRAVFLLKQARAGGYESKYIDLDAILNEAEDALEWQAYRREAEREYIPISALVKHERTRKLGCQAFRAFRKTFPDYDPDNLAAICFPAHISAMEWCKVPAGSVKVYRNGAAETHLLKGFEIGKYPVTNAQYLEFLDAPDGYARETWWDYSPQAAMWRKAHTEPIRPKLTEHNHPCVNVCWFEAVAFCRWMSEQTGAVVALPTEAQWQRTAQGDDGRAFPWGDIFDTNRCNTSECKLGRTVPVTHHVSGVSPYGVMDMAGNVWEWCRNLEATPNAGGLTDSGNRVIKGGSYIGTSKRADNRFHYSLRPECRYSSIGFRLIRLAE